MAMLFQDEYKTCRCGNKNFFIDPIYAFEEKSGELTLLNYHFKCTNCNESFIKSPRQIKENTLHNE